MLNLVTINVQGLRDKHKRLETFQTLKNENYDVIAIQETHCDILEEQNWKDEWEGKSSWTTFSNDKAGVAFLFNPRLDVQILEKKTDLNGRVLCLMVQIENHTCQLVNIYGPNPVNLQESEHFFREIDTYIAQNTPPILFGDFNMVEDIIKDRRGGTPKNRHKYGHKTLKELTEGFDLIDIWRTLNPHRRIFTWHRADEQVHSRLDRIYLPSSYKVDVSSAFIQHFVWSDHDVCGIKMTLPNTSQKGKGFWKLNIQYLKQERYRDRIEEFWTKWLDQKNDFEDIGLWWDCFKVYVKSISIEYAKEVHALRKNKRYKLLEELNQERDKVQVDTIKIKEIEQNLLEIEKETNEKIFIHTHTANREVNEEPTKYFYSMLREKQNETTMESLMNSDGVLLTNQDDMMAEAKDFYGKLYEKNENVSIDDQNFFLSKIDKFLTREQKDTLDKTLELDELEKALKEANATKTPGYDGLPYEFYDTFWHLIGKEYLEVVNFCLNVSKSLPFSQRTSIIALIYKKNEKHFLKNWRPINLLCCDYKILSKAIANRLKEVLDTVLSENQTCSVPGRQITQNLRYIRDAIFFCDVKKLNGYILSVDQEKAFDMMDRDFVIKIFRKMNFGEKFIQWIEIIFQDNIGRILMNGYISIDFAITRGVRQGCSLSAYVYVIYLQALDCVLSSNAKLIGLPIPGRTSPRTSLYADDLTLILWDKSKISEVQGIFTKFENATGSKINREKTQGLALGHPNINDLFFDDINWKNHEGIEILGILFFAQWDKTVDANWSRIYEKMEKQLNRLRYRKLSLKGKVTVLNTLVLSKAWYVASVIPLPESWLKKYERLIRSFLWGKKNMQYDPIERRTLYQPKENGGLDLKNMKVQQNALQLKFFKDIINHENLSPCLQLPRYWIGFDLEFLNPLLRTFPRAGPTTPRSLQFPHYTTNLDIFRSVDLSSLPEPKFWTTRMFYGKLIEKDEHFPTAYTEFWNNHQVDPEKMWKNVHTSLAHGIHQDIHFKFVHRIVLTNAYMKNTFKSKGFRNINPYCASCPDQLETNEHVFFRCVAANPVMDYIRRTISVLLLNQDFRLLKIALNKFPQGTPIDVQKWSLEYCKSQCM